MSLHCVLRFRHPNLLTLMGYCVCKDNFCLVYEFMSNGTLEDALANSVVWFFSVMGIFQLISPD